MKLEITRMGSLPKLVASFAEAWIEMIFFNSIVFSGTVASFAEAWIEI